MEGITAGSVLVTASADFVGSHLTENLLESGNEAVVVDYLSNGNRRIVFEEAEFLEGDLTDPEIVEEAVEYGMGFVFHLAARKDPNDDAPRKQFRQNTTMTNLLIE